MQLLDIHKATFKDLPRILSIYAYARNFMRETDNATQWKNNYPPETMIINDINHEHLYVIKEENTIHAVFAFTIGIEPTYLEISQGRWLSDTEYGTLHRIAGDGAIHGVFDTIIKFCNNKINHLRIDTHKNNKVMQHLISKNGFQKCGIIHVADGSPRIAYEKLEIT